MTREQAEKATQLLAELKEITKFRGVLYRANNEKLISFQMVLSDKDGKIIAQFDPKHSNRFLLVYEEIVKQLNNELESL